MQANGHSPCRIRRGKCTPSYLPWETDVSGRTRTSSPSSLVPRISVKPVLAATARLAALSGAMLARTRTPALSQWESSREQCRGSRCRGRGPPRPVRSRPRPRRRRRRPAPAGRRSRSSRQPGRRTMIDRGPQALPSRQRLAASTSSLRGNDGCHGRVPAGSPARERPARCRRRPEWQRHGQASLREAPSTTPSGSAAMSERRCRPSKEIRSAAAYARERASAMS